MQLDIQIPSAFSVHDENEFFAFQHLLARMNPGLCVTQVATGVHVNGGCTVFWGLVHHGDQKVGQDKIEAALADAGFDFDHNPPVAGIDLAEAGVAQVSNASLSRPGLRGQDTPDQPCFADG